MPELPSAFLPPRLLRHGHLATILSTFLPGAPEAWTREERLELDDGDFIDVAWSQHGQPRLAILSHGLEGSHRASYIRGMTSSLTQAGWDVLAWSYRGCSGTSNRLLRSYHSGETGDLRFLVGHAACHYENIALVGFSLGGNVTLKYAGEAPAHPAVSAVIGISAPVDLGSSALALDERTANRIYQRRFLKTLLQKASGKSRRFPHLLHPSIPERIHNIVEFDEHVTAPLHGFTGAADYYQRASALPLLGKIAIPALLLNALNDPLLDSSSFPSTVAALSPGFILETPAHGGHLGFHDFANRYQPWHERRAIAFLNQPSIMGIELGR